jgi:nitronate monooxygenase
MLDTALNRLLNLDVPIVQAPIAGLTGPELVAAVSNAGAFGMLLRQR